MIKTRDSRKTNWLWVDKQVIQDKRLSASEKLLYTGLAFFANNDSQSCFPSVATLVDLTGLSKNTVLRSFKKLVECEYISVEKDNGRISVYTLLELPELQTGAKMRPVPNVTNTGAKMAPPPVPNVATNYTKINNTKLTTPPSPPKGDRPIDIFLKSFNEKFNKAPGKEYRSTPGREKKLALRLKSFKLDEILLAVDNLSRSAFHRGKNDRGWVADPDFLIRNDEQVDKWRIGVDKPKIEIRPARLPELELKPMTPEERQRAAEAMEVVRQKNQFLAQRMSVAKPAQLPQ